jgi:hypothetical protein
MSYTPTQGDLTEHIRVQVAVGWSDVDDITEETVALFGIDEAEVRPLVEAAWTAEETAIETWPDVTDCDRLDAAFAALANAGVLARVLRLRGARTGICGARTLRRARGSTHRTLATRHVLLQAVELARARAGHPRCGRRAAAIAMLEAWDRAEAAVDALCSSVATV